MHTARSEPKTATSLAGMLADIADELSAIEDWQIRIKNVLCLIDDHYPTSVVSVGLQMEQWEVISCADTQYLDVIGQSLMRAYSLLTSQQHTLYEAGFEADEMPEAKSCITIPVIGAGEIMGVLSVRSVEDHAYSVEDVGAISTAALMIGSFAQNVLAHEEDVRDREQIETLAAKLSEQVHVLQQSLLAKEPSIAQGYRLASAFIPGGGLEIGGDFYDVFDTRDGKIGLIIGDVAGKGIASATLAVATRSTIRAYVYENSRPSEALSLANSMTYGLDPTSFLFVTVFIIVFDPPTGRFTYACAGHPPPVLRRAENSRTESLQCGGSPVGILPNLQYQSLESHLNPGDKIIFYTDGISEARHNADLFGVEGIENVLQENGHLPPDDLLKELLSQANAWSHGRLTDDIALIVMERNPA